jgi:hypothetical protein
MFPAFTINVAVFCYSATNAIAIVAETWLLKRDFQSVIGIESDVFELIPVFTANHPNMY